MSTTQLSSNQHAQRRNTYLESSCDTSPWSHIHITPVEHFKTSKIAVGRQARFVGTLTATPISRIQQSKLIGPRERWESGRLICRWLVQDANSCYQLSTISFTCSGLVVIQHAFCPYICDWGELILVFIFCKHYGIKIWEKWANTIICT
jgi:phosphopantetheinyl transferase